METQTIEYKQQPMSNEIEIKKTQIEMPDSELISLADKITQEVERGASQKSETSLTNCLPPDTSCICRNVRNCKHNLTCS